MIPHEPASSMDMDRPNPVLIRATEAVLYILDPYLRPLNSQEYGKVHAELFNFFEGYDPARQQQLESLEKLYMDMMNTTIQPIILTKEGA